jgi:hypothetical protein
LSKVNTSGLILFIAAIQREIDSIIETLSTERRVREAFDVTQHQEELYLPSHSYCDNILRDIQEPLYCNILVEHNSQAGLGFILSI